MIKKILPFIVITLMLGCATSTSNKDINISEPSVVTFDYSEFQGLIDCKHKYDINRQFKYYQKDAVLNVVDDKLSIYEIIDTNDKVWYINNFEILNYHCVQN